MQTQNQELIDELKQAIDLFIQRQELVAQAMIDMGLNIDDVGKYSSSAWSCDKTSKAVYKLLPNNSEEKEVIKKAFDKKLPQQGYWVDENQGKWEYFLHGKGCKLTNCQTGEPIDWDCPDVTRFNPWKFAYHLTWYLNKFQGSYPNLRSWVDANGKSQIDDLVRDLVSKGILPSDMIK